MTTILFGAGVYAKKFKAILDYLNIDFQYFTDNDKGKWGTILYGRPVIPPDELSGMDCNIIISCTHEEAIRKQLRAMNLAGQVIGLHVLYSKIKKRIDYDATEAKVKCIDSDDTTILVDIFEGIGWGGTEMWAARLGYGLWSSHQKVYLLGGMEQPSLDVKFEKLTIRISPEETIKQMVAIMESQLPFVLINNFTGCAFIAAAILKEKYPDMVKIISVIHNDNKSLFDSYLMMDKYMDSIFCVSNEIKENILKQYNYNPGSIFYKEQPIWIRPNWKREYSQNGSTLKIGYAARLVKQQKRADLLTDLIKCLEEKKVDYILNIAGEGECESIIRKYIAEHDLKGQVNLLGRIPNDRMDSFWEEQDVFVNISEYEGTSLSMLEAMGFGCVPVVTDVSGVKEFIIPDKNGYIHRVGDIEGIADSILDLSHKRDKLKDFGLACSEIIKEKCNPDNYINYWIKEII